jgi:hypothetical protein
MRAETHYVDQLMSRRDRAERSERSERSERAETLRPQSARTAAEPTSACDRHRQSDRVLAQVGDEVAAISLAATMLASEASPLARRVGLDLVRAQAWRASWLLKASALIDGRHRGLARPTPLSTVAEQVRQGLAPECRLAGVNLQMQCTDPGAVVAVDVPLMVVGVTGAVMATLALVESAEGTTIRVSFEASGHDLRSVDVSQDLVSAPPAGTLRFFDLAWSERPGGWTAGMGALSARAAAQHAGGNAVFVAGDRRGSTVRLSFGGG